MRGFAPSLLAILRPCRRVSYSASLFEALKFSLTAYSNSSPIGDIRTIPKPEPLEFSAPLQYKVILKLCIANENINEITHQLEVKFSSINIFTTRTTTNFE